MVVAYSFGCRLAAAAVSYLEKPARLLLIDGPIGGGLGSLERAFLTERPDSAETNEQRLVTLLSSAAEEGLPSLESHSLFFVASEDAVGLDEFTTARPTAPVHRVQANHREMLRAPNASSIADHIAHHVTSREWVAQAADWLRQAARAQPFWK